MEALPTESGYYAFMNHSSSTLPQALAASEDDRSYARQKRKRTSMEDQAVLEEAYKRDPKPDKTARLEIVKQVALGEREVQIWFQNRRQSSRRKSSRPLLPHEVAQYQMSRLGPSVPASSSATMTAGEQRAECREEVDVVLHESRPCDKTTHDAPSSVSELPPYDLLSSATPAATDSRLTPQISSQQDELRIPVSHVARSTASTSQPISLTSSVGSTADQRLVLYADQRKVSMISAGTPSGLLSRSSIPSSFHLADTPRHSFPGPPKAPSQKVSQRSRGHPAAAQRTSDAGSGRQLTKAPSCVRLSMSSDGVASVVTEDGTSLSPPRAPPVSLATTISGEIRPRQLTQSQDGVDTTAGSILKRSSSGRARDSRAWEFWCDKESRSELELKAEKDLSGSAADAIGLLRSSSARSILGPLSGKRNSLFVGRPADAKRSKLGHHRPPLQSANTSLGRLQSRSAADPLGSTQSKLGLKHAESALSVYVPGNDSDKENWSSDSDRPLPSQSRGTTILSKGLDSKSSAVGESRSAGNAQKAWSNGRESAKTATDREYGDENADPETDPELAAFTRGGRQSNSMSSDDDLDCVQGLLSLSQGNWR